jgi:hypothetical protein
MVVSPRARNQPINQISLLTTLWSTRLSQEPARADFRPARLALRPCFALEPIRFDYRFFLWTSGSSLPRFRSCPDVPVQPSGGESRESRPAGRDFRRFRPFPQRSYSGADPGRVESPCGGGSSPGFRLRAQDTGNPYNCC